MSRSVKKRHIAVQIAVIVLIATLILASFAIYAQSIATDNIQSYTENLIEMTKRNADSFSIFFESKIDLTESLAASLKSTSQDHWTNILMPAGVINDNTVVVVDKNGNDVFAETDNIGVSVETLSECMDSYKSGIIGPVILSIMVGIFISKIFVPMLPYPKYRSIAYA